MLVTLEIGKPFHTMHLTYTNNVGKGCDREEAQVFSLEN